MEYLKKLPMDYNLW